MASTSIPFKVYEKVRELTCIGNRAAREGQAENRRLGIPNDELSREDPFEDKDHTTRSASLLQ